MRAAVEFAQRDDIAAATDVMQVWGQVQRGFGNPNPRKNALPFKVVGGSQEKAEQLFREQYRAQLVAAQAALRTLLRDWGRIGTKPNWTAAHAVISPLGQTLSLIVSPGLTSFSGDLRSTVLIQVGRALAGPEGDRVRTCPECSRLFVKVTRKEYCSTRCQSRVYMRTLRKREKDAKKGGRRAKARKR